MRLTVVCMLFGVASLLGGCGNTGTEDSLVSRTSASGKATIGIRFDEPGLGYRRVDGAYEGFDIDVARYIARELGVDDADITWVQAPPAAREDLIKSGQVDFVVASYTITPEREEQVDFAGPYLTYGQDLLVLFNDHGIDGPQSLRGKRLCTVQDSLPAKTIKSNYADGVKLVEYNSYSACVTALLASNVDAVTTLDVVLAGFAAQHPELLRVVGKPFTEGQLGVGLKQGDTAGRQKIDAALGKMVKSGAWRQSLERNLGAAGYQIPEPPALR